MGLFILESKSMTHVPGTTRYFDDPDRPRAVDSSTQGLKCDRTGPVPIILVPQPSDDPNDPLNWPLWKRDLILFLLSVVSIFATCLGPILAANTLTLSIYFHRRFTAVALLTGYYLLGVGIAGIIFVPSARVWGKRHLFLLGTIIVVLSSAWGGASTSYVSLLWARIFQGIGTAPFEALVNAVVGDMYCVHQRGARMALSNLAMFGGAFFTPILVGKITHTIGWPWSFYFVAIFTGVCLPLVVFFVPETAYRRSSYLNTDLASSDDVRLYHNGSPRGHQRLSSTHELNYSNGSAPASEDDNVDKGRVAESGTANHNLPDANTPKMSFAQTLLPFNGRVSDEHFFRLLFRPFPLFFHPAVFWAALIQGTMIGWTVFIGIILAAVFLGPPLYWNEVDTGYAYTGAFIGAIGGFIFAGVLADWSAKYMTRKNNGVYEPEFRIVLIIPSFVLGITGLYLFGVTASNLANYSYILPIFAFGLQVAGMVVAAVGASLYIVDAHRDISVEIFTCLLIFKNFLSFGLTWSAYDWVVKAGPYKTFMWISSVQVFIFLLSVPMYIFGKKNRAFFHKHDILRMTGLY